MKTIYSTIALLLLVNPFIYSQNIGINGTGANAHPSALLDVDDAGTNTKGLLIPRIALTAINVAAPVTSPATSLLIYNTASASSGTTAVSPGYYYWDGTRWVRFAYSPSGSSANDWNILGNTGTSSATNFLGTTDAQDLVFRTNNIERVRALSNGNVGIGTATPGSKLHVYSSVGPGAIRNTVDGNYSGIEAYTYNGSGSTHPYFMGLAAKGTSATPTYPLQGEVLSAFIGRDAIDGLTSSTYGGAQVYMFANENFSLANKGTYMSFGTTPNGTNNVNERMRIDHNGNVGINTSTPYTKLHVYNSVDGIFNGIAIDNRKIYGLGTGTNETSRMILSLSEAGAPDPLSRIMGYIEAGTESETTSQNGFLALGTNSNTVVNEKMRITGNGNVGINTINPLAKFEIQDNGNRRTLHVEHNFNGLVNTDAAFIGGFDAGYTSTGLFVLQKDNVSFVSAGTNLINVVSNSVSKMLVNGLGYMGIGTTSPALKLHLHDGGQNFHALRFTSGVSQANYWDLVKRGDAYGAGQNHNFVIAFNLVERLNITPTGEFGIGTATPSSRLDVLGPKPTAGGGTGVSSNAASQAIIADGSGGASYRNDWPGGWGGGLATWDVCGEGTFFALYNTRSDKRLKKDIADMNASIENSFMKLRPVTYLFKKETPEINGTQYGFIAQEVAELFPTLVTKDTAVEGATIGMNYQGLIAPTIYVVQEQQKKIEQQQSQITELLKRIEALEKK